MVITSNRYSQFLFWNIQLHNLWENYGYPHFAILVRQVDVSTSACSKVYALDRARALMPRECSSSVQICNERNQREENRMGWQIHVRGEGPKRRLCRLCMLFTSIMMHLWSSGQVMNINLPYFFMVGAPHFGPWKGTDCSIRFSLFLAFTWWWLSFDHAGLSSIILGGLCNSVLELI
jgi:hypothetical protein